jgi:hypothetical protein
MRTLLSLFLAVGSETEFAFKFTLEEQDGGRLLSTYKGKLIAVRYWTSAYVGRGIIPSAAKAIKDFVVANYGQRNASYRQNRFPFKSHGFCQSHGSDLVVFAYRSFERKQEKMRPRLILR